MKIPFVPVHILTDKALQRRRLQTLASVQQRQARQVKALCDEINVLRWMLKKRQGG